MYPALLHAVKYPISSLANMANENLNAGKKSRWKQYLITGALIVGVGAAVVYKDEIHQKLRGAFTKTDATETASAGDQDLQKIVRQVSKEVSREYEPSTPAEVVEGLEKMADRFDYLVSKDGKKLQQGEYDRYFDKLGKTLSRFLGSFGEQTLEKVRELHGLAGEKLYQQKQELLREVCQGEYVRLYQQIDAVFSQKLTSETRALLDQQVYDRYAEKADLDTLLQDISQRRHIIISVKPPETAGQ